MSLQTAFGEAVHDQQPESPSILALCFDIKFTKFIRFTSSLDIRVENNFARFVKTSLNEF